MYPGGCHLYKAEVTTDEVEYVSLAEFLRTQDEKVVRAYFMIWDSFKNAPDWVELLRKRGAIHD